MIKSFKCKYTKQLFDGKYQKKFSHAVNKIGKRKLDMLEASFDWKDLKIRMLMMCISMIIINKEEKT